MDTFALVFFKKGGIFPLRLAAKLCTRTSSQRQRGGCVRELMLNDLYLPSGEESPKTIVFIWLHVIGTR